MRFLLLLVCCWTVSCSVTNCPLFENATTCDLQTLCKWNSFDNSCVGLCAQALESDCVGELSEHCCWDYAVGEDRCRSREKSNSCGLANTVLKCPLLQKEDCEGSSVDCTWYENAGCRTTCNFKDSAACTSFDGQCRWVMDLTLGEMHCESTTTYTEAALQIQVGSATTLDSLKTLLLPVLDTVFEPFKTIQGVPLSANIFECTEASTTVQSELCRRFAYYVNRNRYQSSLALEFTLAVVLKDVDMQDPAQLGDVHRSLAAALLEKEVELSDMHVLMNYGDPEADSALNRKLPNILMLVADDLGWGDVGFQNCQVSDFEETKNERICSPDGLTPNIDAMSESPHAAVINRFYTTPLCGPSRSSMLTGREPIRECTLVNAFAPYQDDVPPPSSLNCVKSIAEFAKEAGMRTFHAGKWHVGKLHKIDKNGVPQPSDPDHVLSSPGDNGFDEWYSTPRQGPTYHLNCGCFPTAIECLMGPYNMSYLWNRYNEGGERKYMNQNDPTLFSCENYWFKNPELDGTGYNLNLESRGGWPRPIVGDDSEFIVDRFEQFLDRDMSTPFFAALWFHAPHGPFIAPPEFHDRAVELVNSLPNPDECGVIFDSDLNAYPNSKTCVDTLNSKSQCRAQCKEIKTHYYGSVLALDAQVGRLRTMLKQKNIADNTFVIFMSDNGPARFDSYQNDRGRYIGPSSAANLLEWKFSIHEGGIRVPAVIEFPRLIKENMRVEVPATSVDLLPTTLELLQLPYNQLDLLDGVSLVSVLSGGVSRREKPIVIVNSDRDISFIQESRTFVKIYGGQAMHFKFDDELNKLRRDDENDAVKAAYDIWKKKVFDVSPCNDPDEKGGLSVEECAAGDYVFLALEEELS